MSVMKPGRELDAIIAKHVMGLQPCSDPIGRCDGAKTIPCQCWGVPNYQGVVSGEELASYSTSIADAWLVVEKLDLFSTHSFNKTDEGWTAWRLGGMHDGSDDHVVINTTTAAHAFCIAALDAVGVKP